MMQNYHELLAKTLAEGSLSDNRTGTPTIKIPGGYLEFDLAQGFPAITTKKLFWPGVTGELIGFMRGYDNAADFRALGCGIWDQNANENEWWLANPNRRGNDDLGRIYGVQWRRWRGANGVEVDQLMNVLNGIVKNPNGRRHLISAWRPDEADQMSLEPCHVLYQFIADTTKRELHLMMYQRSADMFLGVPFNIASCALFLSLVAHLTGYTPRWFKHSMGDVHIYEDHVDQVRLQLSREHHPLPRLVINDRIPRFDATSFDPTWIERVEPADFTLDGYVSHPAIKARMAV